MRTILVALAFLLAALAVGHHFGVFRSTPDGNGDYGDPRSSSNADSRGSSDDGASAPRDTRPDAEKPDLVRPPSLAEGLYALIEDLVTGKVPPNDVSKIKNRVAPLLDATGKGDDALRSTVAITAAAALEQEMRRAAPPKSADGQIPPQAYEVMRALSRRLAGELERMLDGSKSVHEGSLLSESVEFTVPEGYERVVWRVLGGFDYEEGMPLPAVVTALSGRSVAVAGYMLAIGGVTDIRNFILVESQWSCCFGVAPELHQLIEVRLPKDARGVDYTTAPVRVLGVLEVGEEVEQGFVTSVYRVVARQVDELDH